MIKLNYADFFSINHFCSKKRRGISQIFGSLMLLAIVVPIGGVILINGTSEINAFNNELSNSYEYRNDGVQEDIVFEHVRLDPDTKDVTISLRNTGTIETTINRITIVNMTDTNLLFKISGIGTFSPTKIPLKESTLINFEAILKHSSWSDSDPDDEDHEYKISVITQRGNFFDTVVRKYNT